MDNRITKKRLNDHLSYDWLKYLAIILAGILLWVIIFSLTKVTPPNNMTFRGYIITGGIVQSEMDAMNGDLEKSLQGVSLEVSSYFYSETDSATISVLTTRMTTKEPDYLITDAKRRNGDAEHDRTIARNLNEYVDTGAVYSLSELIDEILSDDFKVNEDEVRSRKKKERKFNAVRSEADFQAAIAAEYERVQKLKDEAKKLACYLGIDGFSDERYPKIEGLAYEYERFRDTSFANSQITEESVEDMKIWGLNVGYVGETLPLPKIVNLLYFGDQKREYGLGLTFKKENMPYAYDYVKALNAFIERYK